MPHFKKLSLVLLLTFSLSGCIKSIVGAAVDTTIEVVKVPFKVGGAVVDVVKGEPKKKQQKDNPKDQMEPEE